VGWSVPAPQQQVSGLPPLGTCPPVGLLVAWPAGTLRSAPPWRYVPCRPPAPCLFGPARLKTKTWPPRLSSSASLLPLHRLVGPCAWCRPTLYRMSCFSSPRSLNPRPLSVATGSPASANACKSMFDNKKQNERSPESIERRSRRVKAGWGGDGKASAVQAQTLPPLRGTHHRLPPPQEDQSGRFSICLATAGRARNRASSAGVMLICRRPMTRRATSRQRSTS